MRLDKILDWTGSLQPVSMATLLALEVHVRNSVVLGASHMMRAVKLSHDNGDAGMDEAYTIKVLDFTFLFPEPSDQGIMLFLAQDWPVI